MELLIEKPVFRKNNTEEIIFREVCARVNAFVKNSKLKTGRRLIIKFCIYFGLLIAVYAGIFVMKSFVLLAAFYIAFGMLLVLLGLNFAHDFAHNSIFKNKKLNNFCFEFLFMLMGINGYLWKKRHTHSHHNYPNTEGYDVDIELGRIIHLSENEKPGKMHKYQYLYAPALYMIYTLYWIFYKDPVLFYQKQHANLLFKKHDKMEHIKLWGFKLVYISILLVLPVVYGNFTVWQILAAFGMMHAISALFLLFTFLITHHVENTVYYTTENKTLSSSSWLMHQVGSSNDFHSYSKTANFIFGGFNCHIAHHLFPGVNHIYYPALSWIIADTLNKYQLKPNRTTFFGGIGSHIRLLKKLGKRF